MNPVQESFPESVDFFGEGKLTSNKRTPKELPTKAVILFEVSGDERGLCAICFEEMPRAITRDSKEMELANVLASKFINQLSEINGIFLMVSPPTYLDPMERKFRHVLNTLVNPAILKANTRQYDYKEGRTKVKLRLTYLKNPEGTS